jgi:serine/threonine-protein kinase
MARARAGTVLDGRYQLGTTIAEGSMGCVYRASRTREGRRLAIKIMASELVTDDTFRARFLREAEVLSRLQHERIVSILDFGVSEDGLHYLVMDEIEGSSLAQHMGTAMPAERVARLLIQAARGLAHAHERGVVHRDLKPDNIMLGPGGDDDVRLVDFGIAILSDPAGGEERLTARGLAIGTPEYMAPEHLTSHPVDARSDLFSLGVIAYELLCGAHPFEGSRMQIAQKMVVEDAPPCAERVPGLEVDADLESIVRSLLARDPASRPESARELRARLESWLDRRERATVAPGAMEPLIVELFVAVAGETETPIVTRKKFLGTLLAFPLPRPKIVAPALGERLTVMMKAVKRRGVAQLASAAVLAVAVAGLGGMAAVALAANDRRPVGVATDDAAPARGEVMRLVRSVPAEPEPASDPDPDPDPEPVPVRSPVSDHEVEHEHAHVSPAPAPAPAATPDVTTAEFDRLYRATGERLDLLASAPDIERLAKDYMAIPYADALRSPAVLNDAMRRLRAIDAATR